MFTFVLILKGLKFEVMIHINDYNLINYRHIPVKLVDQIQAYFI